MRIAHSAKHPILIRKTKGFKALANVLSLKATKLIAWGERAKRA